MEQEHYGGKNDKKDHKSHPIRSLYAESNAIATELILWHKYKKQGRKGNVNILPLIKPLNNYKK